MQALPNENLLDGETSPYLLQHAGNPVHWRPWGRAALAEAQAAGKPLLISIGYAACHWCHVMAHESFEDAATAALMNRLFVNIKVDREERPDIDHIYMAALHALGDQGGWPLTMFAAPDGTPFWGGTYFPPEPRWGRPSFRQVLQGVAQAYDGGAEAVVKNAAALSQHLREGATASVGDAPQPALLDAVAAAYLRMVDPGLGGLRGAPKFPNAPIHRFLWQDAFRSGREAGLDALHLMLRRMAEGGIYDHLGGGFARYATDETWLVPHFEKMLYDNAQLLELLALAHAHRPQPLYAASATETVGWLLRRMRAAPVDGKAGFAASEDADSEGEEGRFYVWSEAEVDGLLGADAEPFKRAYDVTAAGNWEGKTILHRVAPAGDAAAEALLARCRKTLFEARERRVRPGWDDKVLGDWNGLTIAALARAAAVFGESSWLEHARNAFDFVVAAMAEPAGSVAHAWRQGRTGAAGLIDDQAAMARAGLALHEATGDAAFLAAARRLAEAAMAGFADGHGGFFTTAAGAADVPMTRPRHAGDDATPSGNGLMAEVFARLYHLTGEPQWRDRASGVLRAFGASAERWAGMPTMLAAADLLEEAAVVVIAGGGETTDLIRATLAAADPAVVLLRAADTAALPVGHPARGKPGGARQAVAYVCRRGVCGLPTEDAGDLADRLMRRSH